MGANHHIHLTTQITISISIKDIKDKDLQLLLPEPYRDDFELIHTEDYIEKNIVYPEGVEEKYLVYALKKEYLKDVQAFIIESLLMAKEILNKHREREWYDDFIEKFKQFNMGADLLYSVENKETKELSNSLMNIEDNMFTTYTEIPDMVVYYGFPKDLKKGDRRCSMVGFDIVYSYFKFQESVDETLWFNQLKEQIKSESTQNRITDNLIFRLI
ncbi:hypothetical protein GSY74_01180 [Sulfurovum sp. bin170]|uniref:hypothetical protein n=1 Tax=Sulfurovum sp. bin170 TaxID=2695268 RepID=UPI0013E0682C|nr:hypothetical protein [Sulfurovum sp. bin170]NEW59881.1 hypothetical protein [Sulfurovum sp. bin170]